MNPKDRLCVALDVPAAPQALALAKKLKGTVGLFKIGLELFTSEGPSVVRAMQEMMKAVVDATSDEAAKLGISQPLVLAVTVLTSIDEGVMKKDLRVREPLNGVVRHFAEIAKASGANGVIASPREIRLIRRTCGEDFVIIAPGVRPAWAAAKVDQRRVATPGDAIAAGADYIVVGRPIIAADDQLMASQRILNEITESASLR